MFENAYSYKLPLLYKGFHDVTPWLLNFKMYRIKF